MRLSEATNRVIDLARKIREYYAAELPKRHPNYPVIGINEESAPPPPEEAELKEFFLALPKDLIYQLILIMYLGRGDFGTDDLPGYYQALKNAFGKTQDAISQMMDKAPLAEYLLDGLDELHKHKIDVDKLPLKKATTRK